MIHPAPKVVLTSRVIDCHAATRWDPDSNVLTSAITDLPLSAKPEPTLGAAIDARFGIDGSHRLVIGELDIMLDAVGRLRSIEMYTSPVTWERAAFEAPQQHAEYVWMAFDVSYDTNRLGHVETPTHVSWDGSQQVVIRVGAPRQLARRVALADTLFAGIDVDATLLELHFQAVDATAARGFK
jgi:hypothetical protein